MIFKQKFKSRWSVGASEAIAASSFYQWKIFLFYLVEKQKY